MGDLIIAYPHGVWSAKQLEREGSSGTGEVVLAASGAPLFVPPASTVHGVPVDQAISALRSCVRKSDLKFTLYWTAQLDMIGLARTVWYTFLLMMFSDVGLAYPSAPLMAFEMYQLWLRALEDVEQQQRDEVTDGAFAPFQSAQCPEARRIIMSMATMACVLPKSRLVSHANSAQLLHHQGKLNQEDWIIKIGSNRKLSAVVLPLRDAHTVAVSKAITCLTQYIIHQYEPGMLRVADLLMEWGHTALIWDVIDKVCSHVGNLQWARYYHHRYARMWYWSTGKGVDQSNILFEVASFGWGGEEEEGYSEIPLEWKARHDQSRPYVMSRVVPIQCLLLIVRSNPGILEGITPERCTQYDKTVDEYYGPVGKMNRRFEVPEEAKTLFTTEGRLHGRGFDLYWQESEQLSRMVDTIDPYEQVILEGYISEEAVHGVCGNDSIISRRISQPGYYTDGYEAANPLRKKQPIPKGEKEEVPGEKSSCGEDEELMPHRLQRRQRKFRTPKPGPPQDIDAMAILGREFEEKALIQSSSSSLSLSEMEEEEEEEEEEEGPPPPPFLASPVTMCIRRKAYKCTPTALTLDWIFTWRGKLASLVKAVESPQKRRRHHRGSREKSFDVCGPMTMNQATKAVMCNTVEQRLADGVFPRQKVSIRVIDEHCYLLSRPNRRKGAEDTVKKRCIFRWCEGCPTLADTSTHMDAWIGLETGTDLRGIDLDTIPVIDSRELLEWSHQMTDATHTVETTERKRDPSSTSYLLLKTIRARFEFLTKQCVFL